MIRLAANKETYWLDLPLGVRLKVRPLTTAVMASARATAQRMVAELSNDILQRREVGADLDGLPDVTDPDVAGGIMEMLIIKALARHAIIAWEGVLDPDSDAIAPVTGQTTGDLMEISRIADAFWIKYTDPVRRLDAEKNASGRAPNGTGGAAPEATIAAAAAATDPAAPGAV